MFKWVFAALVLGSAIAAFGGAEEKYSVILGGEKRDIEEGFVYGNKYCQIAFLNPTLHGGAITVGDFNIITRKDISGRSTLDEAEARHRIFFKPDVRVRSTGRRSRAVYGSGAWSVEKIPGGVRYKRTYSNLSCKIAAMADITFDPVNAQVFVKATLQNEGRSSAKVEWAPDFTFLRSAGESLEFMLQRFYGRYIDGRRIVVPGVEKTLMNGNINNYWWRRIAGDDKEFLNASYVRETIPFRHKRLLPPQFFGVVNLPGKGLLIWDMGKDPKEKIARVKVSWETANGIITPEWDFEIESGAKKEVSFRILPLRGLSRFDTVDANWVFSFIAGEDLCTIQSLPLAPKDKLSIAATVENMLNKQILINQRSELAAMTPFAPSRVEWRSAEMFQHHIIYPVKITLATFGGKNIMESSGNIIR